MGHFPSLNFLVSIPSGAVRRLPENIFELSKLDDSVILPTFLSTYKVYNIKSASTRGCAATSGASGTAERSRPREYKAVSVKDEMSPENLVYECEHTYAHTSSTQAQVSTSNNFSGLHGPSV